MSTRFQKIQDIELDRSNSVELLIARARNRPEREIYTFLRRGETEAAQLTYFQLDRAARAIATWLQAHGAKGDRALLLYPPGLDFITAFLGCLYAGIIAVPAYPPKPNRKLTRLQAIVKDARPTAILTTSSLLPKIEKQFVDESGMATLHWLASDRLDNGWAAGWQKPEIDDSSLAFLQYTSGSTGTPKGVMVTHGNLWHNSALIYRGFEHSSESKGVIWLPSYHDMGLIGGVLQPLYGDFPVILMSPLDFLQKPIRWLKAISQYRATTSGGPNFAYELVCQKITAEQLAQLDLSSWDVAFTGAEPIRAETLDKFAATFEPCGFRRQAFYPCYGMAETTLIVTGGLKAATPVIRQVDSVALERNQIEISERQEHSRSIVGCGKTAPGLKIAIADPHSRNSLLDKQVGEIWIAGTSVARGYWQQSEQTKDSFAAYLADTGEGPFLRTGDLGFLEDGELFVTGRIKDIIIIRGQNYYPQDIELTVEKSHPALKPNSGAAFAINFKGSERLVIVQEVKRTYLRKLAVKEVVNSITQAVAAEHSLQTYATVLVKTSSIPKTSSGKIQRHACKAEFIAGSLNVVGDWSENPQDRAKFRHLQAEVDSIFAKLEIAKQKTN